LFSLLENERAQVIAGGTNLIPWMRSGEAQPELVVDLHSLPDLRHIRQDNGSIEIGALTTHADLAGSDMCAAHAPLLASAAASIGSPQIRSRGTIGGNIATASPAADTVPALLALKAEVAIASRAGKRQVPLQDLLLGPGRIDMARAEVITGIQFSPLLSGEGSAFLKVGRRNASAISVVNAAVLIRVREGTVQEARIALGAVASTVVRCRSLESFLEGRPLNDDTLLAAGAALQAEIEPISDLRASAGYRRTAAKAPLNRALLSAAQDCQEDRNRQAKWSM
jgi:CO/xanthine dehydrogenase FAD-binding subunit